MLKHGTKQSCLVQKHPIVSTGPTESCIFSQLGKLCFLILVSKMDALDALFKLLHNSVICIRLLLKVTQ